MAMGKARWPRNHQQFAALHPEAGFVATAIRDGQQGREGNRPMTLRWLASRTNHFPNRGMDAVPGGRRA